MHVLIWIVEDTWRATVAAAAAFLPADADITLLYVTPSEAEAVARVAPNGLFVRAFGPLSESREVIFERGALSLLVEAQQLLGRQAVRQARRGRVEREVVAAAGEMDLLVLARDRGRAHRGARSLGPTARFVVDHAPGAVLLVWPEGTAPGARNGGEDDQRIDS